MDKQLLFTDLSSKLPYGVICHCIEPITGSQADLRLYGIDTSVSDKCIFMREDGETFCHLPFEWIKPYLRPMSSMTEEEKREYNSFIKGQQPSDSDFSAYPIEHKFVYEFDIKNYIDWMNKHHFDYRGLIEKGLAIEAPKGMYKVK